MNTCPDCGKPLYEDAIHTCSPQYDSEADTTDLIANSKLPPALALANHLERTMQWPLHGKAADELRRLHEANEAFGQRQQWWNERMFKLEAENEALREALKGMIEMFKDVPTLEQFSYDEPPEPRTQWDYEALLMIGDARATLARAGEKA